MARRGGFAEKVLAVLTEHQPEKFDIDMIADALSVAKDGRLQIHTAVHELTKSGEINKEKKAKGWGSWYFAGDDDPLEGYEPKSKGTKPQPADTTVLSQYLSPGLRKGKKVNGAAGAPVVTNTSAGESPGAGRQPAPAGDLALTIGEVDPKPLFAIRSDGQLAISCPMTIERGAVELTRDQVRELKSFLIATESIWEAR